MFWPNNFASTIHSSQLSLSLEGLSELNWGLPGY